MKFCGVDGGGVAGGGVETDGGGVAAGAGVMIDKSEIKLTSSGL